MIHHDLWDYDLSAPPILGDITVDGRRVKAVMQTGKNALLYTLDRATGEPVWPIVERPVPQSTVPGEHSSPTQPIPTRPPPLDRQGISPDDLIDFTPDLRKEALLITKPFQFGPMYSPPSLYDPAPGGSRGTLVVAGTDGGGNWNSGAFDPETGTYYTVMVSVVSSYSLVKPEAADATMEWVMRQDAREVWNVDGPQGLPLLKPPPYGRLVAVDMNKGEFQWVVANGDGPREHPLLKPLDLPPLGIPGRAALAVTKNLIFAGESSDTVMMAAPTGGYGNKFRAYSKVDGTVLAEVVLPAGTGTSGAPITYVVNGKQYVVVATSGRDRDSEWIALSL
jgi:quinoprotein glucose dehydrogenase